MLQFRHPNAALADLEKMGIVEEITGRKRGRVFSYQRCLAILSEGTDPCLPAAEIFGRPRQLSVGSYRADK